MALFKLRVSGDDISRAELVQASKTNLPVEMYLENWLEVSPWVLAQEQFLWIGRQTSAYVEDTTIFPDLIGVDADGNLVIVELKKGRTPREVVAQLLEYAAWAHELSEDKVHQLASEFLQTRETGQGRDFSAVFTEVFECEEVPSLGRRVRLFVVAEAISSGVARVCRFLRMAHGVDVSCIAISAYETAGGELLLSTELVTGQEDIVPPKRAAGGRRWSGEKPVKEVVYEVVHEVTGGHRDYVFSPSEIAGAVLRKYPTFNKSTVGCQIISDCVNHTSRHHYPGGEDRYWWVRRGTYRLYDPETDLAE